MLQLSSGKRLAGTIKAEPQDFVVNEIAENGTVLSLDKTYLCGDLGLQQQEGGEFALFVMQKTNWNTMQALRAIAKKFGKGTTSTGFAGTKDRQSVSTQLCSIFGIQAGRLNDIHIKDISINGAWQGPSGVNVGDLLGNRFIIKIKEVKESGETAAIIEDLNGIFPNYFGSQRFGYRENNIDIGLAILQGDFKRAVTAFLTDTKNENRQDAVDARKRLADEQDFKAALGYFPEYLKYERLVIEHLSKFPEHYANAIRTLPRQLSLMFIHSVESHIFNAELEIRVKAKEIGPMDAELACKPNGYGFPEITTTEKYKPDGKRAFPVGNIVGFETKHLTDSEEELMDELDITVESFKLNGLKDLRCRGSYRALFAPYKDFNYNFNDQENSMQFDFSLPAGSYATVLLDEFVESNKITQQK